MSESDKVRATVLIATDGSDDATLIQQILDDDFDRVVTSIDPDMALEDFVTEQPDVLVMAFNSLPKTKDYYDKVYGKQVQAHQWMHRRIVLCEKNDVHRVYQLCNEGYFDDYVLFWPLTHDSPRLAMTVHHAIRELQDMQYVSPAPAEFAAAAQHIFELESMLEKELEEVSALIDKLSSAMTSAEGEQGSWLEGFLRGLERGMLNDRTDATDVDKVTREFIRLESEEGNEALRPLYEAVRGLQSWPEQFQESCRPYLKSIDRLQDLAGRVHPRIMIVDDDAFQRELAGEALMEADYRVVYAGNGVEALNVLRRVHPDLIIMDIEMPELDGLETTAQIKQISWLADIPIIMLTGHAERNTVQRSVELGTLDFIVKPFGRDILLEKVAHALMT